MPETQESKVRERFVGDIATHEMTVLRDDGLYRHLRFKRTDGSSFYWFDLVTWPGVLAISGDCGAFMFSRLSDMFEFFSSGNFEDARWGINPHYWSEKLRAPSSRDAEVYSERVARERIIQWHSDIAEGLDDRSLEFDEPAPTGGRPAFELWQAVREQVLDHELYNESEARRLIGDFDHDGHYMVDAWEWSLREYDWQFLWCCWAIVWGIEKYRAVDPAFAEAAVA